MEDKTKDIKKKKLLGFLPFGIIFVICGVAICLGYDWSSIFKVTVPMLDSPIRYRLITLIGIFVGIIHYNFYGRKLNEYKVGWANILLSFFKSLVSSYGYAYVVNKALNVGSGVLKERFLHEKFFNDPSKVDFVSFGLVALLIVFIGCWEIWKMINEAFFKAQHTIKVPLADEQKNKEESGK